MAPHDDKVSGTVPLDVIEGLVVTAVESVARCGLHRDLTYTMCRHDCTVQLGTVITRTNCCVL